MQIFNARTGKKIKVPRLVRMHGVLMAKCNRTANKILNQLVQEKFVFGVECSSGDTFTDRSTSFSMVNIF